MLFAVLTRQVSELATASTASEFVGPWLDQLVGFGGYGLLVLLVLTGMLVAKKQYEEMKADRDQWRAAYEKEREHQARLGEIDRSTDRTREDNYSLPRLTLVLSPATKPKASTMRLLFWKKPVCLDESRAAVELAGEDHKRVQKKVAEVEHLKEQIVVRRESNGFAER